MTLPCCGSEWSSFFTVTQIRSPILDKAPAERFVMTTIRLSWTQIPPPWYREWVDGTPYMRFGCIVIFQKRLYLWWCSLQDEAYIKGRDAARDLWRYPGWPPSWPTSWILPEIRNYENGRGLNICDARHIQYDLSKHFLLLFVNSSCFFSSKKGRKKHFYSKTVWPPATYGVISRVFSVTDSHQTCVIMCLTFI